MKVRLDAHAKRAPTVSGDEWDVFTGWRRVLCWTHKPGECRRVKRGYNRRLRRTVRLALREADAN